MCPLCLGEAMQLSYGRTKGNLSARLRLPKLLQQKTQYQQVPGEPRGDSSSYVRAPTSDELERTREDFYKRETKKRELEAQAALEQERKLRDDQKRDQEAREFLRREAERVQQEREEREAAKKQEREAESNPPRWIQ